MPHPREKKKTRLYDQGVNHLLTLGVFQYSYIKIKKQEGRVLEALGRLQGRLEETNEGTGGKPPPAIGLFRGACSLSFG
jgi:hypothetical protein